MKNNMSLVRAIDLYLDEHPVMGTFAIAGFLVFFFSMLLLPGFLAMFLACAILFLLYAFIHSIYHIFRNKTKR